MNKYGFLNIGHIFHSLIQSPNCSINISANSTRLSTHMSLLFEENIFPFQGGCLLFSSYLASYLSFLKGDWIWVEKKMFVYSSLWEKAPRFSHKYDITLGYLWCCECLMLACWEFLQEIDIQVFSNFFLYQFL